jgi:hypothetical protein
MKICDLLLGLPPGRACLGVHVDEVTGQLWVELVKQQEVDAELKTLQT